MCKNRAYSCVNVNLKKLRWGGGKRTARIFKNVENTRWYSKNMKSVGAEELPRVMKWKTTCALSDF